MSVSDDEAEYVVLVNHEEQYSLWPARRPIPSGWEVKGPPATRETCLSYIRETWTDMRPKSLREALAPKGKGAECASDEVAVRRTPASGASLEDSA